MLDIKYLRDNLKEVEERLKTRGKDVDLSTFKSLDEKRRTLIRETESLKERKNSVSEEIGRLKKENKEAAPLINEMQETSALIKTLDKEIIECEAELEKLLLTTPN